MLTDRQQEILDFIREQQQIRGLTPSTAEIQEHFGFASPNAVTRTGAVDSSTPRRACSWSKS